MLRRPGYSRLLRSTECAERIKLNPQRVLPKRPPPRPHNPPIDDDHVLQRVAHRPQLRAVLLADDGPAVFVADDGLVVDRQQISRGRRGAWRQGSVGEPERLPIYVLM